MIESLFVYNAFENDWRSALTVPLDKVKGEMTECKN